MLQYYIAKKNKNAKCFSPIHEKTLAQLSPGRRPARGASLVLRGWTQRPGTQPATGS